MRTVSRHVLDVVGEVVAVEDVLLEAGPAADDGDPRVVRVRAVEPGERSLHADREVVRRRRGLIAVLDVVVATSASRSRRPGRARPRPQHRHRRAEAPRWRASTSPTGTRIRKIPRPIAPSRKWRVHRWPWRSQTGTACTSSRTTSAPISQGWTRGLSKPAIDAEQHRPEAERRRGVAEVGGERRRVALRPGRGERRDQVGESAEQRDDAEHPDHRGPPAEDRQQEAADHGDQDERPEIAEAVMQAGNQVVSDHAPVRRQQVVGDVVGFADVDVRLVGTNQRPGLDPGERVAGVDQVASEPEAAGDQRADHPDSGRPPAVARADGDHPEGEQAERRQKIQLRTQSDPSRQAGDDQRAVGKRRRASVGGLGLVGRTPLRIGIDQDGRGREEEEQPHRVVLGVARLVEQKHVRRPGRAPSPGRRSGRRHTRVQTPRRRAGTGPSSRCSGTARGSRCPGRGSPRNAAAPSSAGRTRPSG